MVASRAKKDEASALHEHVFDSYPSTVKQLAKALDEAHSAYAVFVTLDCGTKPGAPVIYAPFDPVPVTPVPAAPVPMTAVPFIVVTFAYCGAYDCCVKENVDLGAHVTPDAGFPIVD